MIYFRENLAFMESMQHENVDGHQVKIYFQFKGDGFEYFKIVLVNLLFNVLTLGFYTPWAIVRKRKYIYQNLYLDDSPFDFTARPFNLFKGFLIYYLFFIILFVIYFNQILALQTGDIYAIQDAMYVIYLLAFLFILLIPVFQWFAFRFRLRYSEWKGVFFSFHTPISEFYGKAIVFNLFRGIPFLHPVLYEEFTNYIFDCIAWGKKFFSSEVSSGRLYKAYTIMFLIVIGLIVIFVGISAIVVNYLRHLELEIDKITFIIVFYAIFLIFSFLTYVVYLYYQSVVLHHTLNVIRVGEAKLIFEMTPWQLFKVKLYAMFINFITLGIAGPFMKVYVYKKITGNLCLLLPREDYLETEIHREKEVSSVGDIALGDFDMDIGLPLGI